MTKKFIKSQLDKKKPGYRTSKSFKGSVFGGKRAPKTNIKSQTFKVQHRG